MLRSIVIYAILVGLPFAGLFVVLHLGGSLTPPPTIAGDWDLDAPEAIKCWSGEAASRLVIEQSGQFVRLGLGATKLDARLEASRSLVTTLPSGPCAGLRLLGSLDGSAQRISFTSESPCSTCVEGFTAQRVPGRDPE